MCAMRRLFLGVLLFFWGASAQAAILSFTPSSPTQSLGGTVAVDLWVSGLAADGEIVSAYDLDILYDASILGLPSLSFDLSAFGGTTETLSLESITPGLVDLALLSFLSDVDLALLQGDSVRLGTLLFPTLDVGASALVFDFTDPLNMLVGADALALQNVQANAGQITVTPRSNAVPEPGALILTGTALAALAGRRLRRM